MEVVTFNMTPPPMAIVAGLVLAGGQRLVVEVGLDLHAADRRLDQAWPWAALSFRRPLSYYLGG